MEDWIKHYIFELKRCSETSNDITSDSPDPASSGTVVTCCLLHTCPQTFNDEDLYD